MGRSIDVVVSGHLCLDLLPTMEHIRLNALQSPGHLFEVGAMSFSTGGAVSNTGLALHKLGAKVSLMSNVGDDLISRLILVSLQSRDLSLIQHIRSRQGQSSSYTLVLSPERVDRIFLHHTGTNATFTSNDLDYSIVAQSRLLHLGYPPLLQSLVVDNGAELTRLFRRAKESDVVTSLDTSLPDTSGSTRQVDWKSVLGQALPFVDIFLPSIEEIIFMLRTEDYANWKGNIIEHVSIPYLDSLANELFQMGNMALVGFKLGEYGIYLCGGFSKRFECWHELPIDPASWAARRIWHPAFEVNAIGTTGAGDSAYAGLLTAILNGLSLENAVRMACAVGACNVEAADATSGICTWEATQQRLDAGWNTLDKRLHSV